MLADEEAATFLFAAVAGLVTFLALDVIGCLLVSPDKMLQGTSKAGFGAFLCIEVLDPSVSSTA